jgi:hypothetical protein
MSKVLELELKLARLAERLRQQRERERRSQARTSTRRAMTIGHWVLEHDPGLATEILAKCDSRSRRPPQQSEPAHGDSA